MAFKTAKREAVPLMISIAGTSGSGKTYSALMLAAGIAGVNGKVGFIDTEAGRGSMYADDIDIINVMPNGEYLVQPMTEPFSPKKYSIAIQDAVKEGIDVLVVDSATHEWEGFGGCQDIAENNKLRGMPNWAMAKMEHKKLMNMLTQCPMHVIFCLRAREKSKPVKNPDTGKTEIVEFGMQPIQEKNFMYEMTLSMFLSDDAPGKPLITKCPKPLRHLFSGDQSIITKEIGEKLKAWSEGGASVDMQLRNLMRESRDAAMQGSVKLDDFFRSISQHEKSILGKLTTKEFQEEVRSLASEADRVIAESEVSDETKKLFNNN